MMDIVRKNGDKINTDELSRQLGCRIIEISALKGTGVEEATKAAISAAKNGKTIPQHTFSGPVEHCIAHIEEAVLHDMPEEQQRWYAIKVFECDEKVLDKLNLSEKTKSHIEADIAAAEKELDDDAESIITNERYIYIADVVRACYKKKNAGSLTSSDKIDKVVTNRWLGLPIFAVIMTLVYLIAMKGPGAWATDWTNDNLFGDGFHLFGIGSSEYSEIADEYAGAQQIIDGYDAYVEENGSAPVGEFTYSVEDEETLETIDETATIEDYNDALAAVERIGEEPDPANYGVFVPSVPALIESGLDKVGAADWLKGLILDGIVAGVGAVLGFVPQMLVLFFLLAVLEACGYMARIAFVLDRVFRRFGLSGKSFIPMLVGVGCGVPGIMASRTIENERDRRMTIITTTFIPCGAKLPFIAMIAGAVFDGSWLIAASAYFVGMLSIIVSGIMLKKTAMFSGDPAPFVMELPAYHMPTLSNALRSTWERGWSFIKKAGTIILLSTIFVWFASYFGFVDGSYRMLDEEELDSSILANIGSAVAWIFAPLGWGNWQAAVASFTGLVAKENIVGTMGILYGGGELTVWQMLAEKFTGITGYSFLIFNLLCAPCFAAIGAIKREMNNIKWTLFAVAYQCGFAYSVSLMITQLGGLFTGEANIIGTIAAALILCFMVYMLFFRKYREASKLRNDVKVKA